MKDQRVIKVAVLFGGVSPEHEVSIISAHQAMAALDPSKYRPVPVYLAKDGAWYTGDVLLNLENFTDLEGIRARSTKVSLGFSTSGMKLVPETAPGLFRKKSSATRVDVVLIGLHGGPGEDGGIQGLCESFNIPYTGSGVFGSALGMDKEMSKLIAHQLGIPVVKYVRLKETEWAGREDEHLEQIPASLGLPLVIKPSRLGSSIGISFANDSTELDKAIEEAFRYDDKVVIEYAVPNLVEINCSVLGDPDHATASVLEQPLNDSTEFLTFEDKYVREGGKSGSKDANSGGGMANLDRIIPAPLDQSKTKEIRDLAVRIFQSFECSGIARIDFLMNRQTGEVFFNEINTIPGSFSFYLWKPTGITFPDLMDKLLMLALVRHRSRAARIKTYDTNLLSEKSLKGLKGSKTQS